MSVKHTKRTEDYSKWYNEIIQRADLAEHSDVRGCMVIKPYGFAIWEKMKEVFESLKIQDILMLISLFSFQSLI